MANENNTPERVLELARGELGATSGDKYIRYYNGITGIGLPYGVAWCAAWVTWVMRHAGVPVDSVLNYKGCATASDWFEARGRFRSRKSGYVPKPGDIIMYEWNPEDEGTPYDDGDDHTGIVEYVEDGIVHTIEGNNGVQCRRDWWSLSNSYISGYCVPLYNMENKKEEPDLTEAEARKIARGEIEKYFAGLAEKPAPGWAKEALDYAREEGILNGDEGGLRPESYVKRDELAQVELNRERRYREIGDVPDWARDAVQELTGLGVILGTEAIQDGKVTLNMSEAQLRGLVFMKRYVDTRLGGKEGGR